jgi:hypothetical protein
VHGWLQETPYIKEVAKSSLIFFYQGHSKESSIKVISNKSWLHKGEDAVHVTNGGEQPIDVAYTIIALSKFYDVYTMTNT